MSASLVGSEMCIRDRSGAWPSLPWGTSDDALHAVLAFGPPLRHGGRATVSYTHLTLPTICSV
eukprot:13937868-Alexandrium_andersonii.AAC.1